MLDREKVGRAISEQRKIKGMNLSMYLHTMFPVLKSVSQWKMGMTKRYVLIWYQMRLII